MREFLAFALLGTRPFGGWAQRYWEDRIASWSADTEQSSDHPRYMYEYRALLTRVHDGDTIVVDIDLGFGVWLRNQALRLIGIQAPESGTDQGQAATAFLKARLPVNTALVVTTVKDKREKYGRMLADVFDGAIHVNKLLLDVGHAVEWNGKGARPQGF